MLITAILKAFQLSKKLCLIASGFYYVQICLMKSYPHICNFTNLSLQAIFVNKSVNKTKYMVIKIKSKWSKLYNCKNSF